VGLGMTDILQLRGLKTLSVDSTDDAYAIVA
jgi:hypothetical protein